MGKESAANKAPAQGVTPEMRDRLVIKHRLKARKLARSILRKWNSRLDIEEVDSVVDLSLCEAAARFRPEMGASFITFLYYHLRGNLIRTISTAANANTVPLFDSDAVTGGDELDAIVANASEIADSLTGTDTMRPDEAFMKREMVELSMRAKAKLDALAREVLDRVYGDEEQLIDIANNLGYSRCHISRVKRRALEAMYDEMSSDLALDKNARPAYEDEVTSSPRMKGRRQIHRRKPRSMAAQMARKVING